MGRTVDGRFFYIVDSDSSPVETYTMKISGYIRFNFFFGGYNGLFLNTNQKATKKFPRQVNLSNLFLKLKRPNRARQPNNNLQWAVSKRSRKNSVNFVNVLIAH